MPVGDTTSSESQLSQIDSAVVTVTLKLNGDISLVGDIDTFKVRKQLYIHHNLLLTMQI